MACDVMRVRLRLRQIRVLEVLADAPEVLRVDVEAASLPALWVQVPQGA